MNIALVQEHATSSRPTPQLAWPSADAMRASFRAQGLSENEVGRKVQEYLDQQPKIRESAKEFEANFVSMLIEEMKKTVEKVEEFSGGFGEEIFDSMLSLETAREICVAGNGFGLAAKVEQGLISKYTKDLVAVDAPESDGLRGVGDPLEPGTGEGRPLDAIPGTMNRVRNGMALAGMKRTYR